MQDHMETLKRLEACNGSVIGSDESEIQEQVYQCNSEYLPALPIRIKQSVAN